MPIHELHIAIKRRLIGFISKCQDLRVEKLLGVVFRGTGKQNNAQRQQDTQIRGKNGQETPLGERRHDQGANPWQNQ